MPDLQIWLQLDKSRKHNPDNPYLQRVPKFIWLLKEPIAHPTIMGLLPAAGSKKMKKEKWRDKSSSSYFRKLLTKTTQENT